MKRILLLLTLGAVLTCPSYAQPDPGSGTPPPSGDAPSGPPPGGHDHMDKILTPAEKAELKKAHDAAIAADPTLETQDKALHDQMKASHEAGTPPSDDLKAQMKAFHEKMNAAMIKADAAVAPILAKLDAAHHHHDGGNGGPPPPPPSA